MNWRKKKLHLCPLEAVTYNDVDVTIKCATLYVDHCFNASSDDYVCNQCLSKRQQMMETFYHGSSSLFKEFDLSHTLEGDGKVKFGYGVYVTSQYRSAAHYAGVNPAAKKFYVYTVEIPAIKEDNYIAFKEAVKTAIVRRAEQKLGEAIPENMTRDGKDFRKYIAKRLTGKVDLEGEKAASSFLLDLGVEFIIWPYCWKNPQLGTNRVVLNNRHMKIVKVDEVELDAKKQLIEGSQKQVDI